MITKYELLKQKLDNLEKFAAKFANKSFTEYLQTTRAMPFDLLTAYISREMKPQMKRLPDYVDEWIAYYNVDPAHVDPRDKEIMGRYIQCFVEINDC